MGMIPCVMNVGTRSCDADSCSGGYASESLNGISRRATAVGQTLVVALPRALAAERQYRRVNMRYTR